MGNNTTSNTTTRGAGDLLEKPRVNMAFRIEFAFQRCISGSSKDVETLATQAAHQGRGIA